MVFLASFHHQRIPLVLLIGGTGATGKSTVATALSERLNLSSVLKTDVVYDVMHTIIEYVLRNVSDPPDNSNNAHFSNAIPSRLWYVPEDVGGIQKIVDREAELVCRGKSPH